MQAEIIKTIDREYAAAQARGVMVDASALGRLKVAGSTRLDLLHRMSTNDLLNLTVGQGAATVFTTPIARIIDRTIVYARDDDVLLLTSRGNQTRMIAWLRKYIFFNDDVQLKDQTEELGTISIYGPAVNEALRRISQLYLAALPLHHWRAGQIGDAEVMIARADGIATGGFHVIGDAQTIPHVWQVLLDAGITPIGEQTYQILRVEAGQPEFGSELTDSYIPLEAGLWQDVSFTKGCYTGQEIIARMESRQRLAKQLVGLRFDGEVPPDTPLWVGDSEVGRVTSAVQSPVHGCIALGYLKAALAFEGQVVQSRTGDRTIAGRVAVLPFRS